MKQLLAPVISNSEVMPGAYLLWLKSPAVAEAARPGQFVMVGGGEDAFLRRPLSVHRVDGDKFALLFDIKGKGTRWLSQRQTGDMVDVFGPLGNGFSIQSSSKKLLLLAGGVGIAPLYFLAQEARGRECSVTMLHGASTIAHLYPGDMPHGTKIGILTEDGSKGQKGMITDLLPEHIDWADQVFACGPVGMYRAMAQMPELKNKPVQLSFEIMMGCGTGACLGCTIKTKNGPRQVCKDGPVFGLGELEGIDWDGLVI